MDRRETLMDASGEVGRDLIFRAEKERFAPSALRASDDAQSAFWTDPAQPPAPMCFDHGRMLQDFADHLAGKRPIGALSSEWLATPEGRKNLARLELLNANA